ncbi:hypothetical protein ACFSVJ_30530 [Prauserella oleivorans]
MMSSAVHSAACSAWLPPCPAACSADGGALSEIDTGAGVWVGCSLGDRSVGSSRDGEHAASAVATAATIMILPALRMRTP